MGKRHKPEEIIAKLRQVEVMTGQGTSTGKPVLLTVHSRAILPDASTNALELLALLKQV